MNAAARKRRRRAATITAITTSARQHGDVADQRADVRCRSSSVGVRWRASQALTLLVGAPQPVRGRITCVSSSAETDRAAASRQR